VFLFTDIGVLFLDGFVLFVDEWVLFLHQRFLSAYADALFSGAFYMLLSV